MVSRFLFSVLSLFVFSGSVSGQVGNEIVLVSIGANEAIYSVNICNNGVGISMLELGPGLKPPGFRVQLMPGQCHNGQHSFGSVGATPMVRVYENFKQRVIVGPLFAKNADVGVWSNIMLVAVGALAASLKEFLQFAFRPVFGGIELIARLRSQRRLFLNKCDEFERKFDLDDVLIKASQGETQGNWYVPAPLEVRIVRLCDTFALWKAKEIDGAEVRKRLEV